MKELFLACDPECWKVQLKITKESIERVDILVCNNEEADTRLRYMSSMQLNIEIRKSVWFLTTHAAVLGVSNSDQAIESPFLLHYQDSTLKLAVIQSVFCW